MSDPIKDSGDQAGLGRIALIVIGIVFALFMVITVSFFKSGESIHWKRELVEIERVYNQGRHDEAALRLRQFGMDRPGAQQTYNWNRQLGEYYARAGNWAESARFYERALTLRPTAPRINALAGESFWMAGNRDRAMEFFRNELDKVNAAVGDHDRAFFFIGSHHFESGQYREALDAFASIAEEKEWADRIAPIRADIDKKIIQPAREMAARAAEAAAP